MAATMRAYRVPGWGLPPEVAEVAVPAPGPGQVLVRVAATGLCHSDLVMPHLPESLGRQLGWAMPFTLGHETAGWVSALGAGATGFAEGDAVAVVSATSCGRCWFCVRGLDNDCEHGTAGRGYGADGGLASHVLVASARELIGLGGLDPVLAGPLTDAGATSYHAVRRVLPKLAPGSTAVVLGAGGLGAFAVQFLRALSPAHVLAVDSNPDRLRVALDVGAHEALPGVDEGTAALVLERTGGRGADAVLDFVGVDATIAAGVAAVRRAGAFALVGAAGGTLRSSWYGGLPRDADVFTFQGGTISDAAEAVALAAAGLVRCDVDRFAFSAVTDAYAALREGRLRGRAVVLAP